MELTPTMDSPAMDQWAKLHKEHWQRRSLVVGGACKDRYPRLVRKTAQGRWHWAERSLTTPDNSLAVRTVHSCTSSLIFTP